MDYAPEALWRINPDTGNIERIDRRTNNTDTIAEWFSTQAKISSAFSNRLSILVEGKENAPVTHPGLKYTPEQIGMAISLAEDLNILDIEDDDPELLKMYLESFLGDINIHEDGQIEILGNTNPEISYDDMMKMISTYMSDLRDEDILSRKEAAEYLGVSESMVIKLENRDPYFPKQKVGGKVIYSKRRINEYLRDK